MLHFRLLDEKGVEMGQRFLQVHRVQPGYRHVLLRNRANQTSVPTTLFVKIEVDVYVPPCQEDLRRQYVDPLKYARNEEGTPSISSSISSISSIIVPDIIHFPLLCTLSEIRESFADPMRWRAPAEDRR